MRTLYVSLNIRCTRTVHTNFPSRPNLKSNPQEWAMNIFLNFLGANYLNTRRTLKIYILFFKVIITLGCFFLNKYPRMVLPRRMLLFCAGFPFFKMKRLRGILLVEGLFLGDEGFKFLISPNLSLVTAIICHCFHNFFTEYLGNYK